MQFNWHVLENMRIQSWIVETSEVIAAIIMERNRTGLLMCVGRDLAL